MEPLKIFIGFDHRVHVGFHALLNSIISRCEAPVTVCPLILPTLPITRAGLTPFTYTRFLVPWLCQFKGKALFLDSDIIVQADIKELFDIAESDRSKAVWVVNYKDANLQFERAAVMLFNNAHPDNRKLKPDYVQETVESLHKIGWTKNIGDLPEEWGHLVLYQPPKPAKLIHYTAGIPIWPETVNLGFAGEWKAEAERMTSAVSWHELMARSVHAPHVMQVMQQMQEQANAKALAEAAMGMPEPAVAES